MRVGMNLLFLVPGVVGGSEPLMTNLASAMAGRIDLTIFAVKGFSEAHPDVANKAHVIEAPIIPGRQISRILAEHTWLAAASRRLRLDILHHGGGTAPFLRLMPTAVTIHDIQYRHFPENFGPLKRTWLAANVPYAARRCASVSVPSSFVKQDVANKLDVDPQKIHVVPFGSGSLFGPQPATEEEVRQTYRIASRYFYYPARTYPHKNHKLLIEAFIDMPEDVQLIFTGAPWHTDGDVLQAISRSGLTGRVRHLGKVPRAHLAGLFRGAAALVYPSRFEGFGAPALEAMSVGTPVIASNVCSLPEVVGDAGILLPPDDPARWTEAMLTVIRDQQLAEDLGNKGLVRSGQYTWESSASAQIQAYEEALS